MVVDEKVWQAYNKHCGDQDDDAKDTSDASLNVTNAPITNANAAVINDNLASNGG